MSVIQYFILMVSPLLFIGSLNQAYAHKVNIFAYAEDKDIFVQGYFADGSKAKNASIEVFDALTGQNLFKVKSDKNGETSFKIPKITSLRLVIYTGMGHKNDYIITKRELTDAMGGNKAHIPEGEILNSTQIGRGKKTPETNYSQKIEIDIKELERIIDVVVKKRIQPIKNMLVNIHNSLSIPGITEIVGGIGYILGLMGIAVYFKDKKRD